MDPLTALGIAVNVLTLIELGAKVLKGAKDVRASPLGTTADNQAQELIARDMTTLSDRLADRDRSKLSEEERELCRLAEESRSISGQLLELLSKIQAKARRSKTDSLWSALKDRYYESDKQALEQRLDRCRDQMQIRMSFWTRQDVQRGMAGLLQAAKADGKRLEAIQEQVSQVQKGLSFVAHGPVVLDGFGSVIGMRDTVLAAVAQHRVLEMLAFDNMHGRYGMVDAAHQKTLHWVFDKNKDDLRGIGDTDHVSAVKEPTEEGEPEKDGAVDETPSQVKSEARERLLSWLATGEGIFHISGKLGSGKSTLMKFLYTRRGTRTKLEEWAGKRNLVVANYFFWNPGSTLQKSILGLYRGLLHGILKSCPDLIEQVLPDAWATATDSPWQSFVRVDLDEVEILNAFERLRRYQAKTTDHCFCLFIDGLDEFQVTPKCDYRDVLENLISWTENAPSTVKICVSSREYNEFMNRLPEATRIRIHQLTRQDMSRFTEDKLSGYLDHESREKIVTSIVDKASGIFLWVSLVTGHIRDQLESDASMPQIMQELETLPDELHALYVHILRSLSPGNRRRGYQLLKMVEEGKKVISICQGIPITSLAYSFMEYYENNDNFAMRPGFLSKEILDVEPQNRLKAAKKRLNGVCRGLVEVQKDGCIDFTHKSVAEFLQTRQAQDGAMTYVSNFQAANAISQLLLAELLYVQAKREANTEAKSVAKGEEEAVQIQGEDELELTTVVTRKDVFGLVALRAERGLDREPYEFLTMLEALIPIIPLGNVPIVSWSIPVRGTYDRTICFEQSSKGDDVEVHSPFYSLSYGGYNNYPLWKIKNDPSCVDTVAKCTHLAYCSVSDVALCRTGGDPSILETLLESGVLSPNTPTRLSSRIWLQKDDDLERTLWQHCIVNICVSISFSRAAPFGRVVESFLRQKPDQLYFSLSMTPQPSKDLQNCSFPTEFRWGRGEAQLTSNMIYGSPNRVEGHGDRSLRECFELSDWENKTTILEMYDARVKEMEDEGEATNVQTLTSEADEVDSGGKAAQLRPFTLSTARNSYCLLVISGVVALLLSVILARLTKAAYGLLSSRDI